ICCAAAIPLLWTGAGGAAQRSAAADTLTIAYEVAGLRVIQRINRASAVVAVRLYLLGGTRQVTKRTAGIEALLLKTSEYGTTQFPDAAARRAMARTGCVLFLEPRADLTALRLPG